MIPVNIKKLYIHSISNTTNIHSISNQLTLSLCNCCSQIFHTFRFRFRSRMFDDLSSTSHFLTFFDEIVDNQGFMQRCNELLKNKNLLIPILHKSLQKYPSELEPLVCLKIRQKHLSI